MTGRVDKSVVPTSLFGGGFRFAPPAPGVAGLLSEEDVG